MDILLSFVRPISEAYQLKLRTIMDRVLAEGLTENLPPVLNFPGLNDATQIYTLRRAFRNQNAP